jgi:hypothetical protein
VWKKTVYNFSSVVWYCVPEFMHMVKVFFGEIFFGSDQKKNYHSQVSRKDAEGCLNLEE